MACKVAYPACDWASSGPAWQLDCCAVCVALSPAAVHILRRRGGRRLRALQASCLVGMRLDHFRCQLYVWGSEDALQEVWRQLASLEGPHKEVPTEVWAELLRTRTRTDAANPHEGVLLWLQRASGCHIHVERSRQEVRLFGTGEEVAAAEEMLDKLAAACCERRVEVPPGGPAPAAADLQDLAQRCEVTLHAGDGHVTLLGLRSAVAQAEEDLQLHFQYLKLSCPCYVALDSFILDYKPSALDSLILDCKPGDFGRDRCLSVGSSGSSGSSLDLVLPGLVGDATPP